jgi:hypothetical protein
VELCLRLARFKKDNKELLTFLLFEADDIPAFIASVRSEMEEQFSTINPSHLYFAKKSLRKVLRITNKYIRYSGNKQAEVELLMHFCGLMKESGVAFQRNPALQKLYDNQVKKVKAAIASLHEDLQYDYLRQVEEIA